MQDKADGLRISVAAKASRIKGCVEMRYCGIEIPVDTKMVEAWNRMRKETTKALEDYNDNPKNTPIPPMD